MLYVGILHIVAVAEEQKILLAYRRRRRSRRRRRRKISGKLSRVVVGGQKLPLLLLRLVSSGLGVGFYCCTTGKTLLFCSNQWDLPVLSFQKKIFHQIEAYFFFSFIPLFLLIWLICLDLLLSHTYLCICLFMCTHTLILLGNAFNEKASGQKQLHFTPSPVTINHLQ